MRRSIGWLRNQRSGTTSVEFAVICPALFLVMFMILGICVLLWTKAAMQMAAVELARCSAIASTACSDPHTYVSSRLSAWGVSGLLPTFSAAVTSGRTCGSPVGTFSTATVSGGGSTWFLASLTQKMLVATACYPSGP